MNFLPFAIIGYGFTAGSIVIDKILLKHSLPNPLAYTFYISSLGLLAILVIPFGVKFEFNPVAFSILSGVFSTIALYTLFQALKEGEASVVGPVVGALNPLFTIIISSIFLKQDLSYNQLGAFSILMLGAIILTFNIWASKLQANKQLFWIITSGFFWALGYIFLRQAFLSGDLLSGLVISRLGGGLFVLPVLLIPSLKSKLVVSKPKGQVSLKRTGVLILFGQSMGALSGLLLAFATSLTNPAIVNSLFGVQYLVILIVALILRKAHSSLLEERLTRFAIVQKLIGAGILSYGVYLLSR
jgi:drug/metabolite transporter (DMT)-like permease